MESSRFVVIDDGIVPRMYIDRISILQLRCFAKADCTFVHPRMATPPPTGPKNVTLVVGDNGSGKTTLLRAVALGMLGPLLMAGANYAPYSLVRRRGAKPAKEARVDIDISMPVGRAGSSSVTLRGLAGFEDEVIHSMAGPKRLLLSLRQPEGEDTLLVAYGARRWTDDKRGERTDRPRVERASSLLFDRNPFPLLPLEHECARLRTENPGRFSQVASLLQQLAPPDSDFALNDAILRSEGRLLFHTRGTSVPFAALSDGYRGFYAWVGDLILHLLKTVPTGHKLVEHEGVVLVDEVDLLLHPSWQRVVIDRLATTFPLLQFIVTTHSPLLINGLTREHVRVMREKGDSVAIAMPDDESMGRSVDQILVGDAFGLSSPWSTVQEAAIEGAAKALRSKASPEASMALLHLLGGQAPAVPPKKAPRKSSPTKVRAKKAAR